MAIRTRHRHRHPLRGKVEIYGDEEWKPDQKAHTEPATFGSVARQFPVGFNEGLADVAGAPVDLAKAGLQGMGAYQRIRLSQVLEASISLILMPASIRLVVQSLLSRL